MLFGFAAMVMPPLAGLTIAIFLGAILIVTSVADAIITIALPRRPGLAWSLASDGAGLMVGIMLFSWPAGGMISLSLALASFLVLDGGFALMIALAHRRSRTRKWAWLAGNGALDIVLAVFTLELLPDPAPWALGLIVGGDILFAGVTLVVMALDERGLAMSRRAQPGHDRKAAAR
jgi:uncharacterized membrane protein HdeD (DUF308 family)